MKSVKMITTLVMFFLAVTGGYGAIHRTLIDFTQYDQRIQQTFSDPANSFVTNINGIPHAVIGYRDFQLSNWTVELNSSSSFIQNRILSYCQPVTSRVQYNGQSVLGVRIHFPDWNNNSYALVRPPFAMKVYDTNGNFINEENGVMPNAWEIKMLSIWISGRGFNYQVAVRLRDRDNNVYEYYMGNLNFEGWRQLVWINPAFTERIFSKSLHAVPLYPRDIPYFVFDSIVIYRQSVEVGGDFITYIGKIDMEYTPYIVDSDLTNDIRDEDVWGIITERGRRTQEYENRMLVEEILLYETETRRLNLQNGGRP